MLTECGWYVTYTTRSIAVKDERGDATVKTIQGHELLRKVADIGFVGHVANAESNLLLVVLRCAERGQHYFVLVDPFSGSVQPIKAEGLVLEGRSLLCVKISGLQAMGFHMLIVGIADANIATFGMRITGRSVDVFELPVQPDWAEWTKKVVDVSFFSNHNPYCPLVAVGTQDGEFGLLQLQDGRLQAIANSSLKNGRIASLQVDVQFNSAYVSLAVNSERGRPSVFLYQFFAERRALEQIAAQSVAQHPCLFAQMSVHHTSDSRSFFCFISTSTTSSGIRLSYGSDGLWKKQQFFSYYQSRILDTRVKDSKLIILTQKGVSSGSTDPANFNLVVKAQRFIDSALRSGCKLANSGTVQRLNRCREIHGELFIDLLLREVGSTLSYPLKCVTELQTALESFNPINLVEAQILLYIVIASEMSKDQLERIETLLSPASVNEIRGYFALDLGNYDAAFSALRSLSKSCRHFEKVIHAFVSGGYSALSYKLFWIWQNEPSVRDMSEPILHALCEESLSSAFLFQRTCGSQSSLRYIFEHCFESQQKGRLLNLLQWPFKGEEEVALISFCKSCATPQTVEFLLAYYLIRSRIAEASVLRQEMSKCLRNSGVDTLLRLSMNALPQIQREIIQETAFVEVSQSAHSMQAMSLNERDVPLATQAEAALFHRPSKASGPFASSPITPRIEATRKEGVLSKAPSIESLISAKPLDRSQSPLLPKMKPAEWREFASWNPATLARQENSAAPNLGLEVTPEPTEEPSVKLFVKKEYSERKIETIPPRTLRQTPARMRQTGETETARVKGEVSRIPRRKGKQAAASDNTDSGAALDPADAPQKTRSRRGAAKTSKEADDPMAVDEVLVHSATTRSVAVESQLDGGKDHEKPPRKVQGAKRAAAKKVK
ncbi:hypothetical protein DFJ73DRAFT_837351 [Zopfochytrium polystomum]|nr:hypothetical protein DFJ73DRAFT_837351 [Zopfochytrium polystomum]